MNRDTFLQRIDDRREPWDIAVIGGGATGVGIAVDAASRGYSVVLLEQSDFGKGTSSRSTKLVHGGVRYLQQGNISLVMEALKERGIASPERAPPRARSAVRRAQLPVVGSAVLRHRHEGLRHAGGQVRLRQIRSAQPRRGAGTHSHARTGRTARRRPLPRRPVRRQPVADQPRADCGRTRRLPAQLYAGHSTVEETAMATSTAWNSATSKPARSTTSAPAASSTRPARSATRSAAWTIRRPNR